MGKHKNATQKKIFIEFMEKNPDLAKGFSKREKTFVESLWQELTADLNNAGPPTKETNGWKKVWTEWKSEIKKKLAHNKAEGRANGGGPYSKQNLTFSEEAIVRICGIAQAVNGVVGKSFDCHQDAIDESEEEMPSTSSKRIIDAPPSSSTPKRHKPIPISTRLCDFLDQDNEQKVKSNDKMDELIKIEKEKASSLKRIYRAIEKGNDSVANAMKEFTKEFKSTSASLLAKIQDKNEIRKQQLELDLLKFDFEKEREEKKRDKLI